MMSTAIFTHMISDVVVVAMIDVDASETLSAQHLTVAHWIHANQISANTSSPPKLVMTLRWWVYVLRSGIRIQYVPREHETPWNWSCS